MTDGGRVLYSSDAHVNHALVARLRGFTRTDQDGKTAGDAAAWNEVFLQNWNARVRKGDRAYILGDFAMNWNAEAARILAAMNGEKILVWGNHDIMSSHHRDGWKHIAPWIGEGKFAGITAYARRTVGKREFLMSHYPYAGDNGERPDRMTQFRLRDEGKWLLHGHMHNADKITPLPETTCFTCGVDLTRETCGRDAGCEIMRSRQIHVGLDAWDLSPVTEEEVIALMDAQC